MNRNAETVMGIDIGRSRVRIAVLDDLGTPQIIQNHLGQDFTPTCLLIEKDGSVVIGEEARSEHAIRPDDILDGVKEHMASTNHVFSAHGRSYHVWDLLAEILRYLKACAEKACGRSVNKTVITVPVCWGTIERKHLKKGAELAGLEIVDMATEDVAALTGYGIRAGEGIYLVFDPGSMTTDASVIRCKREGGRLAVDVLASAGRKVAGQDMDAAIYNAALRDLEKAGQEVDPSDRVFSILTHDQLRLQKESLSQLQEKTVLIGARSDRVAFRLTRKKLEKLIDSIVTRMIGVAREALKQSGVPIVEIRGIVPVGGPSKMPHLRRRLESEFGRPVLENVDPDRATAYGAAELGRAFGPVLSLGGRMLEQGRFDVTPVCTKAIGMIALRAKTDEEVVSCFVLENTPIPLSSEHLFRLKDPKKQDNALLSFVEGTGTDDPDKCRPLQEFVIEDLPIDPQFKGGRILVRIDIARNGIAEMTAEDRKTGKQIEGEIQYLESEAEAMA